MARKLAACGEWANIGVFMSVIIWLLLTTYTVASSGYATKCLWNWFAAPVFGLPAINILQACGIALLAAILTHQANPYSSEDRSEAGQALLHVLLSPWILLAIGAIVKYLS